MDLGEEQGLFEEFRGFAASRDFADFEVADALCARVMAGFFGGKSEWFRAIGMHGSHSPMAVWRIDKERSAVVWIDSEGPVSVIALSMSEFLSLLPYGTGLIYDMFSSSRRLSKSRIKAELAEQAEEYADHGAFVVWLAERGIAPAADPVSLVRGAKAACPDPSALLA